MLLGEHGGELLADGESVLAQVDRRGEHLAEAQPSEALVRLEPAVDQAGDRNAEHPLHRDAAALEVEFAGGAGRCRAGGVEAVRLPRGGVVDQDEPVSSHPGHRQLHHPESGGGGDRRVHGAAPCLHRADAGLRGERGPPRRRRRCGRAPRGGTKDGLRREERTPVCRTVQPQAARSGCMTTRSKLSPITSMPSASGWHSSSA